MHIPMAAAVNARKLMLLNNNSLFCYAFGSQKFQMSFPEPGSKMSRRLCFTGKLQKEICFFTFLASKDVFFHSWFLPPSLKLAAMQPFSFCGKVFLFFLLMWIFKITFATHLDNPGQPPKHRILNYILFQVFFDHIK